MGFEAIFVGQFACDIIPFPQRQKITYYRVASHNLRIQFRLMSIHNENNDTVAVYERHRAHSVRHSVGFVHEGRIAKRFLACLALARYPLHNDNAGLV